MKPEWLERHRTFQLDRQPGDEPIHVIRMKLLDRVGEQRRNRPAVQRARVPRASGETCGQRHVVGQGHEQRDGHGAAGTRLTHRAECTARDLHTTPAIMHG
jgi:hypothetical protein